MRTEPQWGPTGRPVYERTYRRTKADGEPENWEETVVRVVDGNLGLVDKRFHERDERRKLIDLFYDFKALPAGRHLWMSGISGRQFLFNCHRAAFDKDIATHFAFTFDQLMQGGGVGANYSNRYIKQYGAVKHGIEVHLVCDPDHEDYDEVRDCLSTYFSHQWNGSIRVEDSREGWINALSRVLHAFWNGEERLVFDLSLIRHRGSRIRTFGGTAAGPAPLATMLTHVSDLLTKRVGERLGSLDFMLIDHYIATCVVSGNVRRSARMSIKNWADDDVFDFIQCKVDSEYHWSTNISIEIDDQFFRALKKGDDHATAVYEAVVTGMFHNGEPGFYNLSLAQVGEVGDVGSTNPCGEITLEPWENCNLGHVNLDAFHNDYEGAAEAHRLMTRFLVRATFGDVPNAMQRAVVDRNRRIGVGHFGFQGWLVKQGIRFSDSYRHPYVRKTLKDFYNVVRKEARRYAFSLRIPEPIKVTTVAPTGTVAKLPGSSEGIHPIYAKYFVRRVRYSSVDPGQIAALEQFAADGNVIADDIYTINTKVVEFVTKDTLMQQVEDLGLDVDYLVESADEIDLGDMLGVQAMYQECYADNAISFTVNVRPDAYTATEAMKTMIHYLPKLKGTTIMPDGSRPQAPYERITRTQYEQAQFTSITDSIDEDCANGACPIR